MHIVFSSVFKSVLSTNSTATAAFSGKTPTTTKPSGDAVIDMLNDDTGLSIGRRIPEMLYLLPYGTDANNKTFNMRVWGWSVDFTDPDSQIWIPQLLIQVNCTLGNISFSDKGASHFLVDTIAETTDNVSATTVSPTGDLAGHIRLPLLGAELVEFEFTTNGEVSPAAAMNCLFKPFST